MGRVLLALSAVVAVTLASVGVASAETASLGGASATSSGAWVKPTGCSQFPVEYAGLPADAYATIHVLDAATRSDVGSALIVRSAPRSGRTNVQVCSFKVEGTSQILLSLEVTDLGAADSPPFAWSPTPNVVRCVNKRTYTIREFSGRKCPAGWVRR